MEQAETMIDSNPADRPVVTFDANIVIALRNNEPAAVPARQLLTLNRTGRITITITLSTLLEERQPGDTLTIQDHTAWLNAQGIDLAHIFTSPRTIYFRTPGSDFVNLPLDIERALNLNIYIHQSLFPNIPFYWRDYLNKECDYLNKEQFQALIELVMVCIFHLPHSRQSILQLLLSICLIGPSRRW